MKKKRLGEVLRERGTVSAADLTRALQVQQGKLIHLGELLLQSGSVAKKDLIAALKEVTPVPYFDCTNGRVQPEALQTIPAGMAWRFNVLPVKLCDKQLTVVMDEPQNLQILDELRFKSGKIIVPHLGFQAEIRAAIERHYGRDPGPGASGSRPAGLVTDVKEMEFISSTELQRNVDAMREMQAELMQKSKTTPAVLLVASMIKAAAQRKASDIHIEPQSEETSIRLRVDGILREFERIPRALQNSVASRVKILSDMDIAERRAPQDGRFLVKIGDRRLDLRVSTLPTQYGEKVVMRLLESDASTQDFGKLGFPAAIATEMRRMLSLPQGLILVTGPTGSGKSTTLYASLNHVRKPSINIITVEDPVEYAIPGLNQVQVNSKAGLTFATSLRSILRQDPDVIMIGEIRDKETAEITVKAAQTGHLVLSTLHTNDSIAAITRLLDIGVPGFQIAAAATGIIGQRLIRRLCSCHQTVPATPEFISQMMLAGVMTPPATQNVAAGCDDCDLVGYKGQIGIYEMLVVNNPIRAAIREGGRNDEVRSIARRNGMRLMHEYALERVKEGMTTLEEVLRVIPIEYSAPVSCDSCQRELAGTHAFCPHCGERAQARETAHAPERHAVEQGVVN
ncbi:MAG: ATPase, T2SS/T4P/T4SS family [Candidatus Acidiferrales bacterium]